MTWLDEKANEFKDENLSIFHSNQGDYYADEAWAYKQGALALAEELRRAIVDSLTGTDQLKGTVGTRKILGIINNLCGEGGKDGR